MRVEHPLRSDDSDELSGIVALLEACLDSIRNEEYSGLQQRVEEYDLLLHDYIEVHDLQQASREELSLLSRIAGYHQQAIEMLTQHRELLSGSRTKLQNERKLDKAYAGQDTLK